MPWLRPRWVAPLLATLAAFPLWAALSPESGSFVFQTYTPKLYGANPQNWAIAQDARGVMYFANTDGVLEFDGVFWRLIRLTKDAVARSLAVDALGRIYVGGQGVFGYLQPDPHGSTIFVPIEVPKDDSNFANVYNIVPTSAGVYFVTDYKLFFLSSNGQIKVWRASKRFGRIFNAYGELYISTTDHGLQRLDGDDLEAGPAGDALLGSARLAYAPGDHPLLASRQGLFNFTLSEISPFVNSASDYLKQNEIWSARQLSSGSVAIGTNNGGLVLLNRQGAIERVVRKENGLPSDWVTAIFEDSRHAIWLATDNGLARFVTGLSSFAEPQGIHGSVYSVARFGGALYAGTTSGLFAMRVVPGAEPAFQEIADLHEQVFVLADHQGEFFAGGQHGLYTIVAGKAKKIPGADGVIYDLCFSTHDPTLLYTAGQGGVRRWRHVGRTWKSDEPEGDKGQEFRTVVEDADGTVWSTTSVNVWRLDFSTQPAQSHQYGPADGIPPGFNNSVYWFHAHPVFGTNKGLLRFTNAHFVPDDELGAQYAFGNGRSVHNLREDYAGNVWVTGAGYHDLLEKTATGFRPFTTPFIHTGADELFSILLDPDGTSWASDATGALFRLEKLDLRQSRQPLPVLLRNVSVVGQKNSLFGGDSPINSPLPLPYRDNALRFEFVTPFYDSPAATEYQFKLDDSEKNWSNWSTETHKDYTNLFEGSYRFYVRARDPHGTPGGEAVFPFQIAPPFYRTWWAYVTYVSLLLFTGWLILRWRLKALEAKTRWLEGVVEERTAEVRKERDQNEELLLNILPRPVAAELRTNGNVKPTTFDDATVCFSDFVGFTLSSEKLPAETLINALNEYFTAFDEIIGRYGLEKLKTIGDAYMFAGGLPNLRPSHAVDAVLAALEMSAVVQRLSHPELGVNWQIRLGLYSGPVVSGVVGVRKFAFDIWGNTVNFAARMESSGQPGRVNLSETTYRRVESFIQCEPRGAVRIKEGREMEMYFAVGPKPELLQGTMIGNVPAAFRDAYEKAFGEPPRSFPSNHK